MLLHFITLLFLVDFCQFPVVQKAGDIIRVTEYCLKFTEILHGILLKVVGDALERWLIHVAQKYS